MKRVATSAIAPPSPPMKSRRRQWGKAENKTPQKPIHTIGHHPAPTTPAIKPPSLPISQPKISIDSILAGQLSSQTQRAYRSDLKAFLTYLGHSDAIDKPEAFIAVLRAVDKEVAAGYRDCLLAEGKAASTITRRMTAINTAFEILKEEGLISRNPMNRVKRPKVSHEGKTAALTVEQVESILNQPDVTTFMGRRDRVILLLAFFCGLRRSELIHIHHDDIFMTQGHAMMWVHGKGRSDKSDSVLIPGQIWPEVKAFLDECDSGLLFTAQSRNTSYNRSDKPISVNRIYSMFKSYCERAGIDPKGFSPHSTRASFITLTLSGGADVRSVMYAARHTSPSMTIRYDRQRMNLADHASNHLCIHINQDNGCPETDSQ